MNKISLLIKSFFLVILTPLEISKGQRRRKLLKAKKLLNWYPKVTLEECIIKTLDWYILKRFLGTYLFSNILIIF